MVRFTVAPMLSLSRRIYTRVARVYRRVLRSMLGAPERDPEGWAW